MVASNSTVSYIIYAQHSTVEFPGVIYSSKIFGVVFVARDRMKSRSSIMYNGSLTGDMWRCPK